jgi:hypothetical protein
MIKDVGTTKRKPLTPTGRLKLFEDEGGICCICGQPIIGKFIDEHKRALGLGGSNARSNRGIAHPKCAAIKTQEQDMPAINKAKAQKRAAHGLKPPPRQQIKSRGFEKAAPQTDRIGLPARRVDVFGRKIA